MSRRLSEIAGLIAGAHLVGPLDPTVDRVTSDSREAGPGSLFVAIRGFQRDGNDFIAPAAASGASAVASSNRPALEGLPAHLGRLHVPDDRLALAIAADEVYEHPSGKLKLVGVTGTNGKTTTAVLTSAILEAAGIPSATIGTLGVTVNGVTTAGDRTTPEAPVIQRQMRDLVDSGVRGVAMEVASHALDLKRTWGCSFDVGVFTNLTQDHLDYHQTMEEYYFAKKRLFLDYPPVGRKPFSAVVNIDDPFGARLAKEVAVPVLTYGVAGPARLKAEDANVTPGSVAFTAVFDRKRFRVEVPVGAFFNVYNSLAAVGAGLALGLEPEVITAGLKSASAAPGRFESVECGQPYTVIVDYAHTPDGLENVLRSARAITKGRLLVVFGCGGDRDNTKRPIMGRIAAGLADRVMVTSDNPRTEDPAGILDDILKGIEDGRRPNVSTLIDRREAIAAALSEARPGDVVVVAGKGHENYQIFADRTIHFDDREAVRQLLNDGDRNGDRS